MLGASAIQIPACSVDPGPPCWTLETDAATCTSDDHLKLVVTRTAAPDPATVTRMRCVVE